MKLTVDRAAGQLLPESAADARLRGWASLALAAADPRAIARCGSAYLRNVRRRRRYRTLSEEELRATRSSDTVFVLGSGRSILDITEAQWERIARFNTVSFSEFPRQSLVRADYHVVGEVGFIEEHARILRDNPLYENAVLVLQRGWLADDSNNLVGRGLIRPGAQIFRYDRVSRGRYSPPSRSFGSGLVHGWNSSISVLNFCVIMGWRRIVLTGIDLYNKGYFWLGEGEVRAIERPGTTADTPFPSGPLVTSMIGRWREILEPEGVDVLVYNPRSLLAQVLDVFEWDEGA